MPSITSSGIGSGLDVAGLVNQLVSAERAPVAQRLSRLESQTRVEISAYGQLRSALSGLQSALSGDSSGVAEGRSLNLSQETYLGAEVASGAALGSYSIVVERLASSGRSVLQTPTDPAAAIGTGSFTLQLGSDSFQLDFTDPATDLADVRDAINNATDNPGIRASLIQVDGGSVLSLSSDRIGVDSALSFGGSGDFSAFAADISPTQPGEDAQIRIDGMLRTASSNSISDAIEGVTLNLLQADIGQSTTLTVARDDSPLTEALEGFVTAWNAFASRADTLGEYNPVTGNGGPLNGNALLRGIETRLRAVVGQGAGPDGNLLGAEFGLSFDNSGKLELDSTRLNTALTDRRADVAAWWSGEDGLVAKLDTALEGLLDEDASLRSREIALEAQLDRIADREEKLDIRMERVEARYLKQFTALDVALAQLQSTSSYLASQLGSLLGSQQNN